MQGLSCCTSRVAATAASMWHTKRQLSSRAPRSSPTLGQAGLLLTHMSGSQSTELQLVELFGSTRDNWIAADLQGWLAPNRIYPGVAGAVRKLMDEHEVYIVTTKQVGVFELGSAVQSQGLFSLHLQLRLQLHVSDHPPLGPYPKLGARMGAFPAVLCCRRGSLT